VRESAKHDIVQHLEKAEVTHFLGYQSQRDLTRGPLSFEANANITMLEARAVACAKQVDQLRLEGTQGLQSVM
jgi:hypothetical protein